MRSSTIILVLVIGVAVAQAAEANPLADVTSRTTDDPIELLAIGDLHVEAMLLKEAKLIYKKVIKQGTNTPNAELGLARIEIAKAKFKPAKAACQGLSKRHKESTVGPVCFGDFWLANDRTTRAVEEFEKALALGDLRRGNKGLGEVARRRGDHDKAIGYFSAALSAGADYRAHIGLGLTYEAKGNITMARESFSTAVQTEPASCLAHFYLGRLYDEKKRASSEIEIALSIRPDWALARVALGEILLAQGKYEKAAEAFNLAAGDKSVQGRASFGLSRALVASGKTMEALASLAVVMRLVPNHIGAHLLSSDIQFEMGETDAAIDALNKARTVSPGDYEVYLHSGMLYFKMNRFTSARSFLNQAVTIKKDLSAAHFLLGTIACERRLYEAGRDHYKKALSGDLVDVTREEIGKKQAACKPKKHK